jgi:hypothetical protein
MPPAARRAATTERTTTASPTTASPTTADAPPRDGEDGDGTTTLAEAREEAAAAADGTATAGSAAAGSLRQVVSAPMTVARDVVDDVASTLRRPDAVLYLGGVVGLAVLGILEWPVAAVAGVGLAIANGRRRARA